MVHKHHIIPRHEGGTNAPSNLIEVSIEEHAEIHRKRFEELGHWQDELAWKCLSGQIGKEEAIRLAQSLGQKGKPKPQSVKDAVARSNRLRIGDKHHFYGTKRSEESCQKMSNSHKGQTPWNKNRKMDLEAIEVNRKAQLNRKKIQCINCGRLISGMGNLNQHYRKCV